MATKNFTIFHVALLFLSFVSSSGEGTQQFIRREHPLDSKSNKHVTSVLMETMESLVKPSQTEEAHGKETAAVMSTSTMWQACIMALSLTIGTVVCLYWRKGTFVIIKVMIYLLALATIKGAVKMVEEPQAGASFKFPLFLTATHFVSGAIIASAGLLYNSMFMGEAISRPSLHDIGTRWGPIAFAFVTSIALNNMALVYSTSAFVEIVGASGPLITVLMTIFMKQAFDMRLLAPCFVVLVGCTLTSNGDPGFSMLGLLLSAGSNFPRAVKTVLQHLLLQQDAGGKTYSPIEVLAWTCLPASVIIFIWSLCQEGLVPYQQWYLQGFTSQLTLWIFVSCVNATILNTAILFVLKDLGAVGCQLVAQIKSLLVVLGGVCFLKEQVSRMEIFGYVLVMLGVYAYNDLETRIKAKGEAFGTDAEKFARATEKTMLVLGTDAEKFARATEKTILVHNTK